MTPLRRQMIEDMQLHGYSKKTQECYLTAVKVLARHYRRSPDKLSEEEIREFFLYLVNVKHVARSTLRSASTVSSPPAVAGVSPRSEHSCSPPLLIRNRPQRPPRIANPPRVSQDPPPAHPMSGRFPGGGPRSAIQEEGTALNRAHSGCFPCGPSPPPCAPCRAQPYTYALATPTTTPRPFLPPLTDSGLSLPPPKEALSPCLIHRGKCPIK
jgi:Phage integrase, N-terminal SAM-like domain